MPVTPLIRRCLEHESSMVWSQSWESNSDGLRWKLSKLGARVTSFLWVWSRLVQKKALNEGTVVASSLLPARVWVCFVDDWI